jgi:hypothetical protein
MNEKYEDPLSTDGEPRKLVLKPPASWSPKSRADYAKLPAHIQQAVAQREAEVSKSPVGRAMLAGHAMNEKRKVKPGKLVLKPPKSWDPQARRDFSKLPGHVQRDRRRSMRSSPALMPFTA